MTDLIGSLLVAAAVTAVMCVVAAVGRLSRRAAADRAMRVGLPRQPRRRLVGAGDGEVLGRLARRKDAAAFYSPDRWAGAGAGGLWRYRGIPRRNCPATSGLTDRSAAHWVPPAFYQDGRPTVMAYMAAFATLLAVLRWWLDADPMRATRLSLWSVIVTVIVAMSSRQSGSSPNRG